MDILTNDDFCDLFPDGRQLRWIESTGTRMIVEQRLKASHRTIGTRLGKGRYKVIYYDCMAPTLGLYTFPGIIDHKGIHHWHRTKHRVRRTSCR